MRQPENMHRKEDLTHEKNFQGLQRPDWHHIPGIPWLVALTLGCTVLSGLLVPAGIYVNTNVLDGGLAVARGQMAFGDYWIFLVLFVIAAILPEILDQIVYVYVEPARC